MDPQILVFLLLVAGLLLIFVELFVPSGGVISIICVGCLGGSAYLAWKTWYGTQPLFWWGYLIAVAVLIPATIVGAFQVLARSRFGSRVLLSAPTEEEVTPYLREQKRLESLIGQRGVSLNLMTPGGLVNIEGERIHAVSEGLVIESGTPIEIVAVRGTRVVVRPAEAAPAAPDPLVNFENLDTEDEVDPWNPNPPA